MPAGRSSDLSATAMTDVPIGRFILVTRPASIASAALSAALTGAGGRCRSASEAS